MGPKCLSSEVSGKQWQDCIGPIAKAAENCPRHTEVASTLYAIQMYLLTHKGVCSGDDHGGNDA